MCPQETEKPRKKGQRWRKLVAFGVSDDEDSEEEPPEIFFEYCGTYGHTTDECTTFKNKLNRIRANNLTKRNGTLWGECYCVESGHETPKKEEKEL